MTTAIEASSLAPYVQAELARRNLADFCTLMDPSYESTPHTKLLVSHLEALERGDIRNLIVQMPPRHSKTYHVSERFPAWCLGRDPRRNIVIGSYSSMLAIESSREVRRLAFDPRWPFPNAQVSRESTSVERWKTTAGGGLLASGVDSRTTGFSSSLAIIDDPFAGRADADSERQREHVWRWYTETISTRDAPGAVRLVTHTRWHDSDLIGRILNSSDAPRWTVLSLPAIAAGNDAAGRAAGEPLWPERYGLNVLERQKGIMGSAAFEAVYQQNPMPEDGGLVKLEWLAHRYTRLPESYTVVAALDAAVKTGVANDYSAVVVLAVADNAYYVIDVLRRRVEFPDLRRMVEQVYAIHRPSRILIEDASSGSPLVQALRRDSSMPIVPVSANGSKRMRFEAISGLIESGRVRLPEEAPWLAEFVHELVRFPAGKHDDQCDALALALSRASQRTSEWSFARINPGGYNPRGDALALPRLRMGM